MERTPNHSCSRHAGFTLVELLVALSISMMAIAGTMSVFIATQKIAYEVGDVVTMNASTQFVRNRTMRDFRSIRTVATSTSDTFVGEYLEFDTGENKKLQYTFTDGKLYRSVNDGPAVAILSDISTTNGSHFIYKTRTGNYTSDSPANEVIGLEMYIVPTLNGRQKNGLTRNVNIPYKTSVAHFRNAGS